MTRHRSLVSFAAAALAVTLSSPTAVAFSPPDSMTQVAVGTGAAADQSRQAPLVNLAHLDYLGDRVAPPAQDGHTTYRAGQEPAVGVLWTYSEPNNGGPYKRLGGGTYDPATNTWGQGAFNADDISRAAVLYVRHWQATGSSHSRDTAYQLLRGLAYLQTATGPNAGNVVLWMQPDGRLNPNPTPVELPNPSDSGASYWLARTTWALGEGYAAFAGAGAGPGFAEFAQFLRNRMDLAVSALERQVLTRYGTYLQVDGRRTPAWLVVNGADASAEAVLGLAAYVSAGGPPSARTALAELAQGISELAGGSPRDWPFGAVQPWALSRSVWHAWASQMSASLARASQALGDRRLVEVAATEAGTFEPWLLTTGGPDNGRQPTPTDRAQIAYGADSRIETLVAVADATGRRGLRQLAGMDAAWFFGANAAGTPAYDPATGRTVDGIEADGRVNHNAGAESTIHGLLAMLVLDTHPDIARTARLAAIQSRDRLAVLEGEEAPTTGPASVVHPASLWTGESLYSGTGYVALGRGSTVTFAVPGGSARLVMPVVDLQPGSTAVTTFSAQGRVLGVVRAGRVGPQGDSPAPGALLPVTLTVPLPEGATTLTATTTSARGDATRLDAVMLQPVVTQEVLGGSGGRASGGTGGGIALLRNASDIATRVRVDVPGQGRLEVTQYDGQGRRLRPSGDDRAGGGSVPVPAGGFTIVRR